MLINKCLKRTGNVAIDETIIATARLENMLKDKKRP